MKTTKWIMATIGVLLLLMLSGCVEEGEETVIEIDDLMIDKNENLTKTKIFERESEGFFDAGGEIIIGKVVRLEFNSKGHDVIIFEDGMIVAIYKAEVFCWQIGKIHKISTDHDRCIRHVQIIE